MVAPLGLIIFMGFGVIIFLSSGQATLRYILLQAKSVVRKGVPVYVVERKLANLCSTTL